ncbi:MAG: substrate-binding domain-containing protein [Desulfobacteraceae bacterium]|nr:substrate-binding domain-containing protein [Desulfobacteraceae bacterium]
MMKRNIVIVIIMLAVLVSFTIITDNGPVWAKETIRYSCSAQIYDSLEKKRIAAFTKRTGIAVEVNICSSASAVNSVRNDYSDIAATARRLYPRHKEYGYWETVFSKNPMAIIVNKKNPVSSLSEEVLKDIFSGNMANWNEVGGPDEPILLVVPGKNTAAFKNFSRRPMGRALISYDIMTFKSTVVFQVVERFPNAISFIAEGVAHHEGVKTLKIDGLATEDSGYPYYQIFSFVTKGRPSGDVKQFVDDVLSGEGKKIMIEEGVTPFSGDAQ